MSDRITGRCLCGAVQFSFDEKPRVVRACWCRDCQYLSAGNASINAVFRTASFSATGELGEYRSVADSGNAMRRRFCRNCGTPLFSASEGRPDLMVVRVGALDDREICRPASYIWTASAPCWGYFDLALPNDTGQPGPLPGR